MRVVWQHACDWQLATCELVPSDGVLRASAPEAEGLKASWRFGISIKKGRLYASLKISGKKQKTPPVLEVSFVFLPLVV